jgi:RimJ/RimL family protein N-acetyltransferase
MTDERHEEPTELHGKRLNLAPLTEAHLDAVRRWRSDPEVTRYWITQAVPSADDIRAWFDDNRRAGALTWAILAAGRRPIGYTNLFDLDRENRHAEVSLMIGERSDWGHGYAREALRVLLRHAFAPTAAGGLGLHRVVLCVFAENEAARRVYRACGFREDGVLRDDMYRDGAWHDQVLMSVLDREFAAADRDVRA